MNNISIYNILQEVQSQNYKIYVDLDGVIADFDSRYKHFTGLTPKEMDAQLITQYGDKKAKDIFWTKIDPIGPKFWSEMDFMSDAQELLDFLKPYSFKFLLSPSRSKTSEEGKKQFVQKHFPNIELILRIASKKQEFSEPNAILIDDRDSNIEQWRAKGGIGILHKSASNTIKQLEKLGFKKPVDEIQIKLSYGLENIEIVNQLKLIDNPIELYQSQLDMLKHNQIRFLEIANSDPKKILNWPHSVPVSG